MAKTVTRAGILASYGSPGNPNPPFSPPTSSAASDRIEFINRELDLMLRLLADRDTLRPGVATPELIAVFMRYLDEAARLRRDGQLDHSSPSTSSAWQNYRLILERLNRILPKLEQQLRDERSRLTREHDRVSRASAWNSAAKLTR